jgi:predicted nucleotidyltransferase
VPHKFRSDNGVVIDVVPFGGLADAEGFIPGRPRQQPIMCVTGFDDALRHCLQVEVGAGQVVNIVPCQGWQC